MRHRHLDSAEWTPAAVESLYDRGEMADWREFAAALAGDPRLAEIALRIADGREDEGSAALARILVKRFHPRLPPDGACSGR